MTLRKVTLEDFKAVAKEATAPELGLAIPKSISVEATVVDSEERVREFIASDSSVDRDGDTIDVNGWVLEDFTKNGSFLWAHESRLPPIGDPFQTYIQNGQLRVRVRFPTKDVDHPMGAGFGFSVMQMFDQRLLKGVSVGFLPMEWTINEERSGFMPMDFQKQELLEVSAVPVPSNRNALLVAREAGIDIQPIMNWAEHTRDSDTGLWIPKEAVGGMLDAIAGLKTTSVPAPSPETVPVVDPTPEGESPDLPVLVSGLPGEEREVGDVDTPAVTDAPPSEQTDEFEAAIEAAEKAAQEAEDKFTSAVERVAEMANFIGKRGRVLSKVNEEKLRQASELLADVLAKVASMDEEDEDEEKHLDLDAFDFEIVNDDEVDITAEELAKMVAEAVRHQTCKITGRLPD
jgi:hypothetical protein